MSFKNSSEVISYKGHSLYVNFTVNMEGFFQKYITKLSERSLINDNGCHIWQGCTKKGPVGYGVIKAKFPDAQWHTIHAHKLQYLVHNRLVAVAPHLEVSHLCHVPLCVNPIHLSLEPHAINTDRLKCVNREVCSGHTPFADCILFNGNYSKLYYMYQICKMSQ
jgi:hypothetical protein